MFTIYLSAHCHVLRKLQHAIVSLISFDVTEKGFYLDFISMKFSYFVKICSRGSCIVSIISHIVPDLERYQIISNLWTTSVIFCRSCIYLL
jgi:hypothetical protein